ncbi:HEPN domain-containing protein [Vibrio sp. 1CM2L]|uniref:HEPN domain-containing protein n=1 Tax=Vibrio sp. 1CM2L TaxID=2929166 RepID=UPI0020C105A3|nr:HEPN domain-containing protein [Vibrio sp. 1CM2L]
MIITNLATWAYKPELEGLLFFSQRLLELSYDRSDYVEKNIKVPLKDIITECLEYIELQEKGLHITSDTELNMLYDEIRENIRTDSVVKKLLNEKAEVYLSKLNASNDNKELKNILELIKFKIPSQRYLNEVVEQLKEAISTPKQKKKIQNLTDKLYEFLVSYGYQKGTIYFLTNRHFFDKSGINKVSSLEDLAAFLEYFDLEYKEFEVIFTASKIYNEISEACKNLNLKIFSTKEHVYNEILENKFFRNPRDKKVFLSCANVEAVDYQHAMRVAASRVGMLSDLLVVFSHRTKPWFSDYCLVYNHSKNHVVNISKQTNMMSSLSEADFAHTKDIFPVFLSNFGLEQDSFKRFIRSVELHAHALENDETASQILNLWICLEALLITGKTKSHISTVIESISLIYSFYAVRHRVCALKDIFLKWNEIEFRAVMGNLGIIDEEEAMAALLSVKQYEKIAVDLLSKLDEQPLIRFKFINLVNILQTRKGISNLIEEEKSKCEKDLRRVYRTRNKIVHQGDINGHKDYLVEMAHFYLDLVLFSIIERKVSFDDISSIDNLIQEMRINIECHKSYLKEKNKTDELVPTDFKNVLFGPSS